MTRFNGCIDLHHGKVKQIVGGSLLDSSPEKLTTNFVSEETPSFYSKLYKEYQVSRCHVIKLGPNNDEAAKEALAAWPGGLQVGGGITLDNAQEWLSLGASKVIVTSYLFPGGDAKFSLQRLTDLCKLIGKDKLVVDVSCRKKGDKWMVAMDKWQKMTNMEVNKESLDVLSEYCSEFLIHAADVEGLCKGIDEQLVERLGEWVTIPTTYAGGGRSIEDLELVDKLSNGKVDLTFGSALDIFGGNGVTFNECVQWNKAHA
ncbi:Phosphoribosylformimino-5-aminoimidazole carboxamide ribotide isomerase [Parasitella parasitica]|nr:Phosphoribosylformimino-5-aminoimidazole carboxamide ribotide isomerase [Parasitella parasitica]